MNESAPPPNRSELLFQEYNEHLRVTEQKYLNVFLLFMTVAAAVAALGGDQSDLALQPVQWLLIALVGGVSIVVMLGFRVWLARYHKAIKSVMHEWCVKPEHNAFQGSTQTNATLLATVVVVTLVSAIMAGIGFAP